MYYHKPQENDTIKLGETISIVADASYVNGTIAEIYFFVDEIEISSSTKIPYSYDWKTNNMKSGWHTIKAEAKANNGASGIDEKKIFIVGNVTTAKAGSDTIIEDGSTTITLKANEPEFDYEQGVWTILRGEGGVFADSTRAHTVFTGKLDSIYLLKWTIFNKYYSSSDEVIVVFRKMEYGSVTDYDGNIYKTVTIGNQEWMAENLEVSHYPDGTAIPHIARYEWGNLEDNNTDDAYYKENFYKYGALYTYAAAKNACPTGWHLPSDEEWTELEDYITNDGYSGLEGKSLKCLIGWMFDGNGTDIYGFSALPGGILNCEGYFNNLDYSGTWWSITESNNKTAYTRYLSSISLEIYRDNNNKSNGFNVRCVKD